MSIYKECDIRGIYNEEFDENDAFEIGRSIGTIMAGKNIVLCGDIRLSTPILKTKLKAGLLQSGTNIIDIGTMPTPVFYFAKEFLKCDGGVMVTASHNPAKYNGFKISLGDMPITFDDIQDICKIVEKKAYINGAGSYKAYDIETDYINYVDSKIEKSNLKVVVDAGNGSTSLLAPKMFKLLGCDVVELFCEYDGRFPYRDPNPAVYEHLRKLQEKVINEKADLGVAFDGDGDRVVFVDNRGNAVTSEESLCLFIDEYFAEKGSSVVYDLKSSSIVKRQAEKNNGFGIMEKSGHAFIKNTFLKNESVLAGEISGHFFFKELGHDDGIYAGLKMAEILSRKQKSMKGMLKLIKKTIISPDIRVFCQYDKRDELLEKIAEMGRDYKISFLDGVRVQYPFGWILVRKSVTEEGITIRIEADDMLSQKKIVSKLLEDLPELEGRNELFIKYPDV